MSENNPVQFRGLRLTLAILFAVLTVIILLYGIRGLVPEKEMTQIDDYTPWSEEVIEVAKKIPVQDGGRVKPLGTYARFKLLTYRGDLKIKVRDKNGNKHNIGPTAWLLDVLFRPDLADQLPTFRLDDTDILKPFGVKTKKRRDRISFNDLDKTGDVDNRALDQLIDRGREILEKREEKGEKSLTKKELQTSRFAQLALSFTGIRDSLDIVRRDLPPLDPSSLPHVNPSIAQLMLDQGANPSSFSFWIPIMEGLGRSLSESPTPELNTFARELDRRLNFAQFGPIWIPPQSEKQEEWNHLGKSVDKILADGIGGLAENTKEYRQLENLVASAQNPDSPRFLDDLKKWQESISQIAKGRNEGAKIETEIVYYNIDYFMKALGVFVLAFLVSIGTWFYGSKGGGKSFSIATIAAYSIATFILAAGIVHRIIITGRPPVSNLYDTIPVITFFAVLLLLLTDLITKKKLFLSLGAALGVIGLFFTFRFELGDAKDNMDPLRAVLDSNYWLATHVITIVIGYSGGLVACFLSILYSYLSLAGVVSDPKNFKKTMTRAVYGILCFTLLFSLVGTILGGIWANDSWGRFWGWDPKENGALLIVLWCLIILHARLAGWLKSWGIHLMSIFGGGVVIFSWFGVNMLEVGLHSYGFTEGSDGPMWAIGGALAVALASAATAWILEKVST